MTKLPNVPPQLLQELQARMALENSRKEAIRKKTEELKKKSLAASIAGMQINGLVDVYTNQVPYELDILRTNLYSKTDLGFFIQTVLGVGVNNQTFCVDFPCNPISPPGLSVTVGPGVIYKFDILLPIPYSVLPIDTNPDHQIYKSFINFTTQTFATPAPTTPGNSVIFLIQGAPQTETVNPVDRPYFNSSDPSDPIFETQPDTLIDYTLLEVKAGVAAPSPTPPTPDAGFIALYYVTVDYGQTSIISGNITKVPGSPFITESLTQKIGIANGMTPAQVQNNSVIYAIDIGTTNAMVANPSPAYGTLQSGTGILIKAANDNTASCTLNVNSKGANTIKKMTSSGLVNLLGAEIRTGGIYQFDYDGTNWQLINPTIDNGFPVGTILAQAASTPDPGFLTLSSTPVSRTTYAALFARIGTIWGAGDGSTTFNLPPPGRTFVGTGWGGFPDLADGVGSVGGIDQMTLIVANLPPHIHEYERASGQSEVQANAGGIPVRSATNITDITTTGSGSSAPTNNIQPSAVVLYQIKY